MFYQETPTVFGFLMLMEIDGNASPRDSVSDEISHVLLVYAAWLQQEH